MSADEQRNGTCSWCGEVVPVDDMRDNDFGVLGLHKVCSPCYEELKSEYGIIGQF